MIIDELLDSVFHLSQRDHDVGLLVIPHVEFITIPFLAVPVARYLRGQHFKAHALFIGVDFVESRVSPPQNGVHARVGAAPNQAASCVPS